MDSRVLIIFFVLGIAHCNVIKSSCEDIRSFVDGHNYRRLQLAQGKILGQPAASEMSYMVWDDELAAKARQWATTFPNNHNPNRGIPSKRFNTGENLFWLATSDLDYDLDVDIALQNWFNEHKNYRYGSRYYKHTGHYTQMAWSDSTHVGCAVTQKIESGMKKFYLVCNYGPGGNYARVPYKKGYASGQLICSIDDCSKLYGSSCS